MTAKAKQSGESMTVTDLRQVLGKRGLDDDGSMTALALRMEDAKRQRTEG